MTIPFRKPSTCLGESAVLFECSPHVSVVFSGSQISCMKCLRLLAKYDVPFLFRCNFLIPKHDSSILLLSIDLKLFLEHISFKTLLHDAIFLSTPG